MLKNFPLQSQWCGNTHMCIKVDTHTAKKYTCKRQSRYRFSPKRRKEYTKMRGKEKCEYVNCCYLQFIRDMQIAIRQLQFFLFAFKAGWHCPSIALPTHTRLRCCCCCRSFVEMLHIKSFFFSVESCTLTNRIWIEVLCRAFKLSTTYDCQSPAIRRVFSAF